MLQTAFSANRCRRSALRFSLSLSLNPSAGFGTTEIETDAGLRRTVPPDRFIEPIEGDIRCIFGTGLFADFGAHGSLLKTAGGCGNLADPHLATLVGGHPSGDPSQGFAGLMDDVRIFHRVLTATETATLYADSLAAAAEGDHTPPVLSQLQAQRSSATSASISASTDEPTRLHIEFGPGAQPSIPAAWNSTGGTSHTQTVPDLTTGDAYTFRLRAVDEAGNLASGMVP